MSILDKLSSVAKKGIDNIEKLTDNANKEWQRSVKPEIKKQKNKAEKKLKEFSEYTNNEWRNTLKPNLLKARKDSLKQWDKLNELTSSTSQKVSKKISNQWDKLWETELGVDIQKYPAIKSITKKDVEEAGEIVGKMIGIGSIAYTFIMLFTTWLPGIGLPVSAGVAVKCLTQIADEYSKMSEDERESVRKVCSYIRFLFTGILHQ